MWAGNLPALLKLRSVYTIDLLGEPGLSIQDRPVTSEADQAQWLHEVLLQLPEPQVHLVGLSIGGYPEASHAINGEYPEEIAADIDAFLTATE